MGVVQGLTEFLPISSSGHLIIVPFLFGWTDPFITSLAFSVMLHIGTLAALLVYFRADWVRLVPAGFAAIRDRSFRDDPDRRLAWILVAATIPAAIAGFLLNDFIENTVRELGPGRLHAGRWRGRSCGSPTAGVAARKGVDDVTFPLATGIGAAQALALVPGISRSGISISAARFAGLNREAAARFSFLMATPIIAGAAIFEIRKLVSGETGVDVERRAAARRDARGVRCRAMLAIGFLLRYLRDALADRSSSSTGWSWRRSSSSPGCARRRRGADRWRS